jgi:hypothetical protein
VADVTAAVGFPWLPAGVIVSAIAGVPATVVLTAEDVPGVSAVALVFAAVDFHFCYCCFQRFLRPCCWRPCCQAIDYRTEESNNRTIDCQNQEKNYILNSDEHVLEKEIKMQRTA